MAYDANYRLIKEKNNNNLRLRKEIASGHDTFPCPSIKHLTPLIVVYGLLLEVFKNVLSEPPLQSITVEPEQTLQSIPATTTNSKHYSTVGYFGQLHTLTSVIICISNKSAYTVHEKRDGIVCIYTGLVAYLDQV